MKKIWLIILVMITGAALTACFGAGQTGDENANAQKATPEEAISEFIARKELDANIPHSYLVMDKYIFLLYNDVVITGMYDDKNGYEMYLPWGTKSQIYIPETPTGLISSIEVMKISKDYLFEIQGYKDVNGVSTIEENSPIKIYDSQGREFEKLFNEGMNAEACVFINVINELPQDYTIYVDYDGKTYTVIDAATIKKLVG